MSNIISNPVIASVRAAEALDEIKFVSSAATGESGGVIEELDTFPSVIVELPDSDIENEGQSFKETKTCILVIVVECKDWDNNNTNFTGDIEMLDNITNALLCEITKMTKTRAKYAGGDYGIIDDGNSGYQLVREVSVSITTRGVYGR